MPGRETTTAKLAREVSRTDSSAPPARSCCCDSSARRRRPRPLCDYSRRRPKLLCDYSRRRPRLLRDYSTSRHQPVSAAVTPCAERNVSLTAPLRTYLRHDALRLTSRSTRLGSAWTELRKPDGLHSTEAALLRTGCCDHHESGLAAGRRAVATTTNRGCPRADGLLRPPRIAAVRGQTGCCDHDEPGRAATAGRRPAVSLPHTR